MYILNFSLVFYKKKTKKTKLNVKKYILLNKKEIF